MGLPTRLLWLRTALKVLETAFSKLRQCYGQGAIRSRITLISSCVIEYISMSKRARRVIAHYIIQVEAEDYSRKKDDLPA